MDPRPDLKRVIKPRQAKPQSLYLETHKETHSSRNKSYSRAKQRIEPGAEFFDSTNRTRNKKAAKRTRLEGKTLPKGAFSSKTVAGRRVRAEARSKAHFSLRKIGEAPSRSEWFKGKGKGKGKGKSRGTRVRGSSSFMLGFPKISPHMARNLSTNYGCVGNLHSLHQLNGIGGVGKDIIPHFKAAKKRGGKKSLNSIKQQLKLTAESGAQTGDNVKPKIKSGREARLQEACTPDWEKKKQAHCQSFGKDSKQKLTRGVLACFQKSPKTRGGRGKDFVVGSPQSLNSMTLVSQKIANTTEMRTWVTRMDEKAALSSKRALGWEEMRRKKASLNFMSKTNLARGKTHNRKNSQKIKIQVRSVKRQNTKGNEPKLIMNFGKGDNNGARDEICDFPGLKKITRLKSGRIKSELCKLSKEQRAKKSAGRNRKDGSLREIKKKGKSKSKENDNTREKAGRKCSSTQARKRGPRKKDNFDHLNYFTPLPNAGLELIGNFDTPNLNASRRKDKRKWVKKRDLKINYLWDGKGFKTTKTAKTSKGVGRVKFVKMFATKTKTNNQTQTQTHKKTAKLWEIFQRGFANSKKEMIQTKGSRERLRGGAKGQSPGKDETGDRFFYDDSNFESGLEHSIPQQKPKRRTPESPKERNMKREKNGVQPLVLDLGGDEEMVKLGKKGRLNSGKERKNGKTKKGKGKAKVKGKSRTRVSKRSKSKSKKGVKTQTNNRKAARG